MSYGRALVEPGEREVAGVGGPGRDGTVREQEVAGEEAGGDRDQDFMGEEEARNDTERVRHSTPVGPFTGQARFAQVVLICHCHCLSENYSTKQCDELLVRRKGYA